jgi:DNA-binding CsgD family transcriptional regulator
VAASTRTPTRPGGSVAPAGESLLTGAPAARRLYREIAAAPEQPLLLSVIGVGGSGKSVLLDVLAALYTEHGATVLRAAGGLLPDPASPGGPVPESPVPPELPDDAVLLVDDAHLLTPAALHALTRLAADPARSARLVLAQRPWPRPDGSGELNTWLTRSRPPLLLGELDRSGVAGRAALLSGAENRPAAHLVDSVHAHTGGLPRLVDRLLGALREAGRLERPDGDPPDPLVEQLYYELERHPEPVRELALALALGAPLDGEVLGPLLSVEAGEVEELTERARAAGLLGVDGRTRPLLARVALRRAPSVRRLAVRGRLAEIQLDRGASVLTAAGNLLDTGATGARVAAVFEAGADEALRTADHPLAARLLDAAVTAGAPALRLAARAAEAAAHRGDLDRALELSDQVLADPAAVAEEDVGRAVAVAASALAQRGLLGRSAELYRWLGERSPSLPSPGAPPVPMAAVPALIGTGALGEARAVLDRAGLVEPAASPLAGVRPVPTLLAGAESLMAQGVRDTIDGSPTAALSQLARAAALLEPTAGSVLLPDTPAALAALVAAHCGELDVAQSVLDRAVAAGLGGCTATPRHRLLQAWTAMSRGATQTARALLAEVDATAGRLEPRDELVAAALEVGLARRAGDLAALMPAWGRAREAIVRHPVDLYVLAPLGELIVASARLREQAWVRPHLLEAHALLDRLGWPALWSASIHWAELHAALQSESWAEAGRQAEALERAARSGGRYPSAMAVAARSWIAVLRGDVDQAAVESAARGLHAVGLSWDGGKLAGQGAIRTTDRKAMTALLQCARGLQSSGQAADAHHPPGPPPGTPRSASPATAPPATGPSGAPGAGFPVAPGGAATGAPGAGYTDPGAPAVPGGPARPGATAVSGQVAPSLGRQNLYPSGRPDPGPRSDDTEPETTSEPNGALSDREREVAALVIEGLTYKQIGERLFISAKTVEHHVARMRQRLGSTSRGELMAHLRMILGNP